MKEKLVFPEIIKQVGFDFEFDFDHDPEKIWKLEVPIAMTPIKLLEWHLEIPFWSSDHGYYDLSPNQLLKTPTLSPSHYQRVLEADTTHPIDYTFYKGRPKIIDGLHRLTKAKLNGAEFTEMRFVPIEILLKTISL